jgi:hypothetical protein
LEKKTTSGQWGIQDHAVPAQKFILTKEKPLDAENQLVPSAAIVIVTLKYGTWFSCNTIVMRLGT